MFGESQITGKQVLNFARLAAMITAFICLSIGMIVMFVPIKTTEAIKIEEERENLMIQYVMAQTEVLDALFKQHEAVLNATVKNVSEELMKEQYDRVAIEKSLGIPLSVDENYQYFYIGVEESKEMLMAPRVVLPDDYDPTSRPWYEDAKQNGQTWTTVYQDASSGVPIITLASPIKDESGKLYGVIGVDIDLSSTLTQFNGKYISDIGYFVVSDESATVLMHPDPEQIGFMLPIQEVIEMIHSGETGMVKYNYNGNEKIAYIASTAKSDIKLIYIDESVEQGVYLTRPAFLMVVAMMTLVGVLIIKLQGLALKRKLNKDGILEPY